MERLSKNGREERTASGGSDITNRWQDQTATPDLIALLFLDRKEQPTPGRIEVGGEKIVEKSLGSRGKGKAMRSLMWVGKEKETSHQSMARGTTEKEGGGGLKQTNRQQATKNSLNVKTVKS